MNRKFHASGLDEILKEEDEKAWRDEGPEWIAHVEKEILAKKRMGLKFAEFFPSSVVWSTRRAKSPSKDIMDRLEKHFKEAGFWVMEDEHSACYACWYGGTTEKYLLIKWE
jgi:hypothetical protein